MSDNNDNLGDDLKNKASELADDAKETASDFADSAKDAANDIKEGWNEATGGENKKMLAGILAIVVGAFGVHKFVLGYQKEGIIMAAVALVGFVLTCLGIGVILIMATSVIGLIEGIIYLTKSDEEFYETYQKGRKGWF